MNSNKVVHIIGIGGIGMSAIAEVLHHLNYKVQGSDAHLNSNIDRLKKLGIEVYIGHNTNNIKHAQLIIYSSAIKSDNIELIEARKRNKIVIHRSDILAELTKDKYTIAVSGSSGKTTTTAMIASILDYTNIDATIIVGGILNSCKSNVKFGKSDIFLIEADESDGTMLKILANIAVITSVNDDHIDYYGTFDNIKRSFHQFIGKADYVILPGSADVKYNKNNTTIFGFKDANVRAVNIRQHDNSLEFDVLINIAKVDEIYQNQASSVGSSFTTLLSSQCVIRNNIKNIILSNAIGLHKVSNALAAISVAVKLGIGEESIRKGLCEFKGIERRFSMITGVNGVKLIEDYAHHPNEIHATLTAARSITKGKVIGIIEPLRFTRVHNFFDEFIKVFMIFNYVILTPIHPPEDIFISGCDIDDIQKTLINNGFDNVKIMNDALLISRFISDFTDLDDIVLFIGAGSNIARLARETAELMARVK